MFMFVGLEGLRPYTVLKGWVTAAAEFLKGNLVIASLQVGYIASIGRG